MKVLQFSGGKDSLACLYLLEPEWSSLTVVWLNAGMAFPETLELMARVKATVPTFVELNTDVVSDIGGNGWPSDVVPVVHTNWGRISTETHGIKVRSWVDCCARNVWVPLHSAMKEMGATVVVRGQRNSERYKSQIRSGHTEEGIRYEFPIQDWSDNEVFSFLNARGVSIPAHYAFTTTSLDCWGCTAYLDEKRGHFDYMRKFHPQKHAVVTDKLRQIREQIVAPLAAMDGVTCQ